MTNDTMLQGDGGLSQLDRYLRALRDRRRRLVLYYLDEQQVTDLEAVSRHLAAQDVNQPPSELTEEAYESVMMDLHHNHLPRLDDYGLIDYDERNQDIQVAESSQTFSLLLQFLRFIEQS